MRRSAPCWPGWIPSDRRIVAETIKYAGYVERQRREARRVARAGARAIPEGFTYRGLPGLSSELAEKLDAVRPETLGRAGAHRRHDPGRPGVAGGPPGTPRSLTQVDAIGWANAGHPIGPGPAPMSGEARNPEPELFSPASSPRLMQVIAERAKNCGVALPEAALAALALHARRVHERNDELHLTSIRDPREFVERHLGESFEGAAMLDPMIEGALLDLGSGNGYPGLAVAAARPGLRPLLSEASGRRAAFLRDVVEEAFPGGAVLERQAQRPADLGDAAPFRVVVTRAVGGWERILPRMAPALGPGGSLLVWAGRQMEATARRKAWGRYRLAERKPLPGRERSWVWRFEIA